MKKFTHCFLLFGLQFVCFCSASSSNEAPVAPLLNLEHTRVHETPHRSAVPAESVDTQSHAFATTSEKDTVSKDRQAVLSAQRQEKKRVLKREKRERARECAARKEKLKQDVIRLAQISQDIEARLDVTQSFGQELRDILSAKERKRKKRKLKKYQVEKLRKRTEKYARKRAKRTAEGSREQARIQLREKKAKDRKKQKERLKAEQVRYRNEWKRAMREEEWLYRKRVAQRAQRISEKRSKTQEQRAKRRERREQQRKSQKAEEQEIKWKQERERQERHKNKELQQAYEQELANVYREVAQRRNLLLAMNKKNENDLAAAGKERKDFAQYESKRLRRLRRKEHARKKEKGADKVHPRIAEAYNVSRLITTNERIMLADMLVASRLLERSISSMDMAVPEYEHLKYLTNKLLARAVQVQRLFAILYGYKSSVLEHIKQSEPGKIKSWYVIDGTVVPLKPSDAIYDVILKLFASPQVDAARIEQAQKLLQDKSYASRVEQKEIFNKTFDAINRVARAVKKWRLMLANLHQLLDDLRPQSTDSIQLTELTLRGAEKKKKQRRWYPVPTWPFEVAFSEQDYLVQAGVSYLWADNAFDSGGSKQDLFQLDSKVCQLTLADIVLTSKLLQQEKIESVDTNADNQYLRFLAPTKLKFSGSSEQWFFFVNYARYIKDNDLLIGIQVPLEYKRHDVKFDFTFPPNANIPDLITRQDSSFRKRYGGDFHAFFDDIMKKKRMKFLRHDSELGLADLSAFVNFQLHSKKYERFVSGFELVLPTGRRGGTKALWTPDLGNGGFFRVAFFSSIFGRFTDFFNPHFFGSLRYYVPRTKQRRIPRIVTFDGKVDPTSANTKTADGTKIDDLLLCGDLVKFIPGTPFSCPDSQSALFADTTTSVNLRKGFEAAFRFGNIFDHLFSQQSYLDIFYDLRLKENDMVGNNLSCVDWDIDSIERRSYEVEHKIATALSYQFNPCWRANFGFWYTFAGRNVAETLQLDLNIRAEF